MVLAKMKDEREIAKTLKLLFSYTLMMGVLSIHGFIAYILTYLLFSLYVDDEHNRIDVWAHGTHLKILLNGHKVSSTSKVMDDPHISSHNPSIQCSPVET